MNILHAIHDFPPRHRAGSELYALALAQAQLPHHDVTVLCAEYDPRHDHGHVVWRVHEGVPVVEIVNNWRCTTFADTYLPPFIGERIAHVLRTVRPEVVHVHNLLNLSFDLPRMARSLGIPVVATLHDYTLVCPSGGQRVHRREQHVCHEIDARRCARCFAESPFHAQAALGRVTARPGLSRIAGRAATAARRIFPAFTARAAGAVSRTSALSVTAADIEARLAAARAVFDDIHLFVAPSASLAEEFERLGVPRHRLRVSDYGMAVLDARPRRPARLPLRIGFVGTLAWHKGAHVLIEAVRALPRDAWTLSIVGSTDTFPDYTADLRRRASGLPVAFAGGFEPRRTAEIYAGFDVLVVPSIWPENSPLVIHEAFMARVPVVGARIGGIPGLVTDEVNGLLYEPESAADLARTLQRLIDDPAFVDRLSASAPTVKSMREDAAEWDAVYREAAMRAEAPAS
jgi:glycosyltransferase involved in cell wall biosynthesis